MSRILIVDDSRGSLLMTSKLLERYGYEVHVADCGAKAIELVDAVECDLAIVDYVMPKIDGVELFRRLRQRNPKLHGIFLTGYLDESNSAAAREAGFDRVVGKPIAAETILPLVEELLGTQ